MTTDLIHRLRAYRAHDATADALMEEAAEELAKVTRHWEEEVRENLGICDALEDAGVVFDPDNPPDPIESIRRLAKARDDLRAILQEIIEDDMLRTCGPFLGEGTAMMERIRSVLGRAAREG